MLHRNALIIQREPLATQHCKSTYFGIKCVKKMRRILPFSKLVVTSKRYSTNSSNKILHIGAKASISKAFSAEDLQVFSHLTGDTNPIHLDEIYSAKTRYRQRIVHGVLCMGLLSGLLGSVFPGPGAIMLSCQMQYLAPLYIAEVVTAEVEVNKIEGRMVNFSTKCTVTSTGKVVCEGTAQLLVPRNKLIANCKN